MYIKHYVTEQHIQDGNWLRLKKLFFALSRWVKIDFKCAQLAPSRKELPPGALWCGKFSQFSLLKSLSTSLDGFLTFFLFPSSRASLFSSRWGAKFLGHFTAKCVTRILWSAWIFDVVTEDSLPFPRSNPVMAYACVGVELCWFHIFFPFRRD